MESPGDSDEDLVLRTHKRQSYRDVVTGTTAAAPNLGRMAWLQDSPPPQLARICLRSEIHRVPDAATTMASAWCAVGAAVGASPLLAREKVVHQPF